MIKKSVCFMNTNPDWGGGEKWHFEAASYLSARGVTVGFIVQKDAPLAHKVRRKGFMLLEIKSGSFSFMNPFKRYKISKWLRDRGVKAVVMNLMTDLYLGAPSAALAGCQTVFRRGLDLPVKNNIVNRNVFKNHTNHVFVISEACKKNLFPGDPLFYRKYLEHKVSVLPIHLDLSRFEKCREENGGEKIYRKAEKETVIGSAGRLCYQKNHLDMIDLASYLKKQNVRFKILLAGTGPDEGMLKKAAADRNVSDKMIFTGFVENMHQFYNSIDIFVHPARWEGGGHVLAEAMASGIPVAAYDVSSNPEIISDGVTGYLAPFLNRSILFENVLKLFDKKLAEVLGTAGKNNIFQKYDIAMRMKTFSEVLGISFRDFNHV